MRRNGTEFMAIGAILVGAAIGAGGTVALVGNPFDDGLRAQLDCDSFYGSRSPLRATWIIFVDRDGEVHKKKCPAGRRTFFVHQRPSRTLEVRPTTVTGRVRVEAVEAWVEARAAAELEATAAELTTLLERQRSVYEQVKARTTTGR